MSKKAKIFKIHFTVAKAKQQPGLRYKAIPVPLIVIAENYARAMEVAEQEIQDFLYFNDCYIKSKRHNEIKALKIINDFKRAES